MSACPTRAHAICAPEGLDAVLSCRESCGGPSQRLSRRRRSPSWRSGGGWDAAVSIRSSPTRPVPVRSPRAMSNPARRGPPRRPVRAPAKARGCPPLVAQAMHRTRPPTATRRVAARPGPRGARARPEAGVILACPVCPTSASTPARSVPWVPRAARARQGAGATLAFRACRTCASSPEARGLTGTCPTSPRSRRSRGHPRGRRLGTGRSANHRACPTDPSPGCWRAAHRCQGPSSARR